MLVAQLNKLNCEQIRKFCEQMTTRFCRWHKNKSNYREVLWRLNRLPFRHRALLRNLMRAHVARILGLPRMSASGSKADVVYAQSNVSL